MRITIRQMLDFAYSLPVSSDFNCDDFGKIVIAQEHLVDRLTDWFQNLNIDVEVEES